MILFQKVIQLWRIVKRSSMTKMGQIVTLVTTSPKAVKFSNYLVFDIYFIILGLLVVGVYVIAFKQEKNG